VPPMLPTLVDEPPEGGNWLHEIKHDGYRTQLVIDGGQARAFTRNGHDWTERYRPIVHTAASLPCQSAILDGELIVQDEQGRSDFHALKAVIHREPERLVFMVFDLVHLDGKDLRKYPLSARRDALQRLLGENRPECPLQFSAHLKGGGEDLLAAVDAMGMEGVVSKRADSRYTSGRTSAWLKTKTFTESDFVLIGVERQENGPAIALLAREDEQGLAYAGGAAVTLKEADRERFWRTVEQWATKTAPVKTDRKATSWVEPRLHVRARYLRSEEKLRHSTLCSLL
jgi:bifunctional non-homologous end joining protein LigD